MTISKHNENSIKYQNATRPTSNQVSNYYSIYFRASHWSVIRFIIKQESKRYSIYFSKIWRKSTTVTRKALKISLRISALLDLFLRIFRAINNLRNADILSFAIKLSETIVFDQILRKHQFFPKQSKNSVIARRSSQFRKKDNVTILARLRRHQR